MARAGGERTWSRAGGQGADERGFTIRQDCILFIFSRTRPTRRGTDRPTEKKRRRRNTINASRFVFCEHAKLRSMCSPVLAAWCMMSLSSSFTLYPRPPTPPSRSRSPEVQTSHHSTWLLLQLFICVKASDQCCSILHKNIWSERRGQSKTRQDVEGSWGEERDEEHQPQHHMH